MIAGIPYDIVIVFAVLAIVLVAFIKEVIPPDIVALSATAFLLAVGILNTEEVLTLFSNSAVITIMAMFIISAALERTGCIEALAKTLKVVGGGGPKRMLFTLMLTALVGSAFMNNTPIVIILTPVVMGLARDVGIASSKLLIPLSFAAILGGTTTLIGTSTNILVSSKAVEAGLPAISMFEMTLPGLIYASAGLGYIFLFGRHLLPERAAFLNLEENLDKKNYIAEVLVPRSSTLAGKTLEEAELRDEKVMVLDVIRNNFSLRHQLSELVLKAGDKIVIETDTSKILSLRESGEIEFQTSATKGFEPISATESVMMQGIIGPSSRFYGMRIQDLNLRRKYGVYVVAVHRQDEDISKDFEKIRLQFGDGLLIDGPADGIRRLMEDGDLISLSQPQDLPLRRTKAPIAIAAIMGVMLLASFNIMPIAGLAFIGAAMVILFGCVDADEAYKAVEWRILFLIIGMLGLSIGMEKTGAMELVVNGLVNHFAAYGPWVVLGIVYVIVSIFTEMISNNAIAVLATPIVIGVAQQMGVDSKPFIMAVMFAASASFATPIGYQTNTFVYGAGGYKYKDFLLVGGPLNIMLAILGSLLLPLIYPF